MVFVNLIFKLNDVLKMPINLIFNLVEKVIMNLTKLS